MRKLGFDELEIKFDLEGFETTDDICGECGFVGQARADEALRMALQVSSPGYHVYVSGPAGTGRRTFVRSVVKTFAEKMPVPHDLVYVNNFEDHLHPNFMELLPGQGRSLKLDMSNLVSEAAEAIRRTFDSEEYSKRRSQLEEEYFKEKKQLWEDLREKAKALGFDVQVTQAGIVSLPVIEGKPIPPEAIEHLPEEIKKQIEENSTKLKILLDGALTKSRFIDREFKKRLRDLDRYVAMFAVGSIFAELEKKYSKNSEILDFLNAVKNDMLDNLDQLRSEEMGIIEYFKQRYGVNLLVDNSGLLGAPVVEEFHPTYSNLLGKIEYYARQGILHTDFTMIRPGAIHRANGGFLIIDAVELLKQPYAWEGLKRVLVSQQARIENLEVALGISNLHTLRPEPIPLSVKVILIGPEWVYDLMYLHDEEFRKLFGVKVPFDWTMDLNDANVKEFVNVLSTIVKEEKLLPFDTTAIEEVLKYSVRLSGDRRKLSTRFGVVRRLLVEASQVASLSGEHTVKAEHVSEAIKKAERRVNLYEEKLEEALIRGELMVETEGERVGQVNGLTVLELPDHSFGIPVRITAKTFLGKPGVIDIQREADLSGKIHSKAVMTLEAYLNWKYGRWEPVSLTATLSFEQVYSVVEGDSASLAETIALISAISELPARQDVAITGSINQHGEVQPVGGVPQKVEGFFKLCSKRGLTGTQGVIIPSQNVDHLTLKDEVLEAVKEGKFHIWTVDTVDEAVEIVLGKKAGKELKRGGFSKGSVNDLVYKALKRARKLSEEPEKKGGKRRGKK
ncbi:MAG: hypothetical protein PWP09_1211 [Thermotogota bacterium]|nr:hypothetical protein [Thermotogota bacterium]